MKAAGKKRRDSYRMREYTDFSSNCDDSVLSGFDQRQSANAYDLKREPRSVSERKLVANSYFHSYETMVRSQDAEDFATIVHLRPVFNRIQKFGRSKCMAPNSNHSGIRDTSFTADHDDTFQAHSKQDEKSTSKALWSNGKSGAYTSAQILDVFSPDNNMCDPREVLTFASLKRFVTKLKSVDSDSSNSDSKGHDASVVNSDFYLFQSDEQLMLILVQFEEAIDEWRRDLRCRTIDLEETGITFSEFVHVYKTVISGMKSLQMLPSLHQFIDDKNEPVTTLMGMSEDMKDLISYQREKTVERSLKMIKEFTHFSSISPVAVITSSDDDSVVFDSNNNITARTQDMLKTTHANTISRSMCITPESQSELKPVQDSATAIVEIGLQITPVGSLRNLKESEQKIIHKTSLKDCYYGKLSVFGILIVVACASGMSHQRVMAWLVPLKNSSYVSPLNSSCRIEAKVALDQEISTEQQLKISLDDITKSRQRSEDKLAKAITRIGTMTLQLEELNDEVGKKNNALLFYETERNAHLYEIALFPFYQTYMDCSIEQPTLSPANLMYASISDESDDFINLDSQNSSNLDEGKFTMIETTKINERQKKLLSAKLVTRRLSHNFSLAANIVKRAISRLLKFTIVSNMIQTAMSAFALFFTKN